MAFLRFSRDKRGYEHFYLIQPITNRRGKVRSRILYWFRTPPNVKVGREPFDDALRQALETQNPDVTFDWKKIIETPIPSPDTEKWRERRRIERAERAARHAESDDAEESATEVGDASPPNEVAERDVAATPAVQDGASSQQLPQDGAGRRRRRRRGRHGSPAIPSPSTPASVGDNQEHAGPPESTERQDLSQPEERSAPREPQES